MTNVKNERAFNEKSIVRLLVNIILLEAQSKYPGPSLVVVQPDLRIPFLSYFDPQKYSLLTTLTFFSLVCATIKI